MTSDRSIEDRELTILKARAGFLAAVPAGARGTEERIPVLTFTLGRETYALEHGHTREVLPLPHVTSLPCVPAFVRGIINVRGRTVPLLDLKSILGLPDAGSSTTSSVIILEQAGIELGLVADEILGLSSIDSSSIQASLPALMDARAAYLKGITADGVVLLDAGKLLADRTLIIDEMVGGAR